MRIPKYVVGAAALAVCLTVAAVGAQRRGGAGRGGPPDGSNSGQDGRGRPGGPAHPCGDVIKSALKLSPEQSTTFDRIMHDADSQSEPLLSQLAAIRADAHSRVAEMLTNDQKQTFETLDQPQQPGPGGRGPRGGGDGKTPPPCGRGRR